MVDSVLKKLDCVAYGRQICGYLTTIKTNILLLLKEI